MTTDERIDRLVDSINTLNTSVVKLSASMNNLATRQDIMELKDAVKDNRHSINKTFTVMTIIISFIAGGAIPMLVI